MKMKPVDEGREFVKSSFCSACNDCVGVSILQNDVVVINTNMKNSLVRFTHEEWTAFVKGVKNGEFDLI